MNINYVVARYWQGAKGSLCAYMTFGSVVHYGTIKDAEEHASDISSREGKAYSVWQVVPLATPTSNTAMLANTATVAKQPTLEIRIVDQALIATTFAVFGPAYEWLLHLPQWNLLRLGAQRLRVLNIVHVLDSTNGDRHVQIEVERVQ